MDREVIVHKHSRLAGLQVVWIILILLLAFPFAAGSLADYDWVNIGGEFENGTILALAYDHNHDLLYASAFNYGVWKYDGSTWTEMGHLQVDVYDLAYAEDRDILYAATWKHGVFKYVGGRWTNTGGDIKDRSAHKLAYDDSHDMLYASVFDYEREEIKGVWRYDGKSWVNIGEGINDFGIRALAYDGSHDRLYAGTYGRGVWRCEAPATSSVWTDTGGEIQTRASINALVYDSNNGYLYAGSSHADSGYRSGVWRYDGNTWMNTGGGYFNGSTISLAYDSSHDVLFAGLESGYVYVYDGSIWTSSAADLGNSVYELLFDDVNGVLYAGTFKHGLWKWISTPTVTQCTPPSGIQGQTIDVEIAGIYTDFVDGISQAEFSGGGITVNSTTVMDATHARANITLTAEANPGPRVVNVITGTERPQALAEGFFVEKYWEWNLYFAEGYTEGSFQEYLCLVNPTDDKALVEATYYFSSSKNAHKQYLEMPPGSRTTVNVDVLSSYSSPSIRVASDREIVAERPMYFDYKNKAAGGHVAMGAASPSTQWYFAEGNDGGSFEQWINVLNPGYMGALVTLTFQVQYEIEAAPLFNPALISEEIVIDNVWIGPHSKNSYDIGYLVGYGCQNSLLLQSTQPVVAERSMYFRYSGTNNIWCEGGHCVMGATSLSDRFYFAEGTTRAGFDEWLIVHNPSRETITIDALYHLGPEQGEAVFRTYELPPKAIFPISVNAEIGQDKDVSATLTSSSQFLAERSVYFDDSKGREGGHCAVGAASPSREWIFAEGYTGSDFEEWLCLYNPGTIAAGAELISFAQNGGGDNEYAVTIPAGQRVTIFVNELIGPDQQHSLHVISDQPIVAERAMYFNYNGLHGGHVERGHSP